MDNLLSKSLYGVVYLMGACKWHVLCFPSMTRSCLIYNPEWLGAAGLNFLTHGLTFVLNTLIVRMVQTNVFGVRTC